LRGSRPSLLVGCAGRIAILEEASFRRATFSCFVVNNVEVPVHKAAELLSLAVNR